MAFTLATINENAGIGAIGHCNRCAVCASTKYVCCPIQEGAYGLPLIQVVPRMVCKCGLPVRTWREICEDTYMSFSSINTGSSFPSMTRMSLSSPVVINSKLYDCIFPKNRCPGMNLSSHQKHNYLLLFSSISVDVNLRTIFFSSQFFFY